MRVLSLIVFCFGAVMARAAVIDRLAVAVSNQIITELQIANLLCAAWKSGATRPTGWWSSC
jgi:Na+-transporting methylmalonyl-CoA/oxaloacetate decarboxylase beta subunit